MRNFCHEQKIVYLGFSLLTANREVLASAALKKIASGLGADPAQVIFAFARQMGMLPLTGTTDPKHMSLDLESQSLTIAPADLAMIEELGIR